LALLTILVVANIHGDEMEYPWLSNAEVTDSIASRIPPPSGFIRTAIEANSFSNWLRYLPLKKGKPPVYLYSGEEKARQDVHEAVIEIDVGARDLQQCADAVIRLRAEYLYSEGSRDEISFNFTSGDPAPYAQWVKGFRPEVTGNRVRWVRKEDPRQEYSSFREYLQTVFIYAGTLSLSRELERIEHDDFMRIGDVFVRGGSPGHAIIVVDMAGDDSGRRLFLLAQSYMPAQDVHILVNPSDDVLSPWYPVDFGDALVTPEWTFRANELMRFKESQTTAEDPPNTGEQE